MTTEPTFMLGLMVAILAILFYIGLLLFMAFIVLRDYINRNR